MEKETSVRLVRNATLKIRYAGHTVLIDPFFADKGTIQSALGVNKSPRVHLTMPIDEITEGWIWCCRHIYILTIMTRQ